jgi:hypothetical protein
MGLGKMFDNGFWKLVKIDEIGWKWVKMKNGWKCLKMGFGKMFFWKCAK